MFINMVFDILILIGDVTTCFFNWSCTIGQFIVSALCLIASSLYSSTQKLSNLLQILVGDFKLFAQDVGRTTSNIVYFLGDIYNYCSCFVDKVTSVFIECLVLIGYGIHFFFANVYLSLQIPVVFIYEMITQIGLAFCYLIMLPKNVFDFIVRFVKDVLPFLIEFICMIVHVCQTETFVGIVYKLLIFCLIIITFIFLTKKFFSYISSKLKRINRKYKKLPKNHELNKSGDDSYLCIICQSESRCILLMPCRHLCLCIKCSNELVRFGTNNCPICRQKTHFRIKVYL